MEVFMLPSKLASQSVINWRQMFSHYNKNPKYNLCLIFILFIAEKPVSQNI